jgi:hypothetical protein
MFGQFHRDFARIDGTESYSIKSVFCGKLISMDKLTNEHELIAFLKRMKGIKNAVIGIKANRLYPKLDPVMWKNNLFYPRLGIDQTSIAQLIEVLYRGKAIEFDLCDSKSRSFDRKSDY